MALTTGRSASGMAQAAPVRDGRRARLMVPLVPALAAFVVSVLGISGASYWLDEAATLGVTRRSVPDMLEFIEIQDLVHALYYFLMKPWLHVFGTSELAARMPTALATAAAAAGVAVLGRRCFSPRVGLLAGLAYAGSVTVVRYAQEARPYAFVAAVAVLASYLLVRAVESPRWRWFAGYSLGVVLLCCLNLLALLLVVAHGVTLVWSVLAGITPGRTLLRWSVAAAASGAALLPFFVETRSQDTQVDWIPRPASGSLMELLEFLAGAKSLVVVILAVALLGAVAGRNARRPGSPSAEVEGTPRPALTMLALPWLVVPPVLLITVSLVSEPLYLTRYVLFCLPAVALLVACGLDWLGTVKWPVMGAVILVIVVLSVPPHFKIREQDERLDDLRAAATVLRERARPGDSILYLSPLSRWDSSAYPDAFEGLKDITLRKSPLETATLRGEDIVLDDRLRGRLAKADRVWVMSDRVLLDPPLGLAGRRIAVLKETGFAESARWTYKGGGLTLYVKSSDTAFASVP